MLKYVSVADWAIILGLGLALLGLLWIWQRRGSSSPENVRERQPKAMGQMLAHALLYVLKLTLFAVSAFVLIGGGVMAYESWQSMLLETVPAPSDVEIPSDLPFAVEEVTFAGGDGLMMACWLVPSQNGGMIILLHGYDSNRLAMRWHAEKLVEAGYGVLMMDERASGESEGAYRSFGWEDPADVGGAVAFLQEHTDAGADHIGAAGCSMGGQIALQSAAYHPQIEAVWADGPAGVRGADHTPPDNWATAISYVSGYLIDRMYEQHLGIEAPAPMIEIIDDIAPRPMMLVGGGTPMPYFNSEEPRLKYFAQFAGGNAEVWIIPEAYHCDGPAYRPDEYSARLIAFFDEAFALSAVR